MGSNKRTWMILGSVATLTIVGGLVVGCVTGIGAYDLPGYSRSLEANLAESKKLGFPTTSAELLGPAIPVDQNAWLDIRDLGVKLEEVRSASEKPDDYTALANSQSSLLDDVRTVLLAKKGWRPERDYDLGPNVLLPELAFVKSLAKAFKARAESRAARGDVDGALSDLGTMRMLSHRVAQEPFLISLLVAVAVNSLQYRAVETIADAWSERPGQLERLAASIAESQESFDIGPALDGEFYMTLATARNLGAFGGMDALYDSGSIPKIDPTKLKRTGVPSGMFERASLSYSAAAFNHARQQNNAGVRSSFPKVPEPPTLSALLASVMTPVYEDAYKAVVSAEAKAAVAMAFLRELGALRRGSELVKLPKDPFAPGHMLLVKRGAGWLIVWSVGPDGKDEGGWPLARHGKGRVDDVAFIFPAEKRQQVAEAGVAP